MTKYALAVDIGGTFTDAVLIASDGGSWTDKTLTTHDNLLDGFFRASQLVLDDAGIKLKDVNDVVAHATTIVTNVLIERKGAPAGLVVTSGFRDVLYIRDEHRYDMFDPQLEYADPLIPREHTWGLDERSYADGTIGKTVDEDDVQKIADDLAKENISSVAVCLLNSYRNPQNEHQFKALMSKIAPHVIVTLSSDVAPQMREYLRASTCAINAYAVSTTRPYLNALMEHLQNEGVEREPLIMLSNGGVIGAGVAGTYPVRMIESGPAAGALVAGHVARKNGIDNLLSFDMGGTTAKACLIQNGEPLVTGDFEVDRRYRFKPGSGMPITVPSIDMIEIGAGGGSVARVNNLGLLKVGPDSAGSNPGPACYGQGGEDACVTDADVVLGILDPEHFLGGDMPLDRAKAEASVQLLADKLGVSMLDAAYGVFSVVGESMAAAARAHATDRGVNYRGMPLFAFGGAGPVHACYVAERLDGTQIIYPPMASVLSAYGTLVTPARLDLARGGLSRLVDIDWAAVSPLIADLCAEGKAALNDAGIADDAIRYDFAADMRYVGQQTEVTVPLAGDPRDPDNQRELRQRYDVAYENLYGVKLDDMQVEVVSWRATARGGESERRPDIELAAQSAAPKTTRKVYIEGQSMDVPIFDRASLSVGQEINGPVIVEERETTAFILPGWRLSVHADGSLIANCD